MKKRKYVCTKAPSKTGRTTAEDRERGREKLDALRKRMRFNK